MREKNKVTTNNKVVMKTLIVDDHLLVREGLQAILRRAFPDMTYVEAADDQAMWAALQAHPDIGLILLDVQLPGVNGVNLLPQLTRDYPKARIVMLSGDYDRETVARSIQQGAAGFLPKSLLDQVLLSALQLVLVGGIYIPAEIFTKPAPLASPAPAPAPLAPVAQPTQPVPAIMVAPPVSPHGRGPNLGLTERQLEVLSYLLEGLSNKQICRQLDLAEATVKIHVRAILRSLQVNSRSEAIVAASRLGIRPEHPVSRPEGAAQ